MSVKELKLKGDGLCGLRVEEENGLVRITVEGVGNVLGASLGRNECHLLMMYLREKLERP